MQWNGVETVDDIPRSWGGDQKDGGCRIHPTAPDDNAVLFECQSGVTTLAAGQTIRYKLDLLITPFREPNVHEHFAQ
eukprot:SAG31_NODE_12770_length_918_cov_1.156288_1_plen_76_part_10